jgi:hypothetical protein
VAKANDEIVLVSALAQIERALDIGILTPSFIR